MRRRRFDIDIVGPHPEDVSVSDLAEFITEFAKAVSELYHASSEKDKPEDLQAGDNTADGPCVSLVQISEGSDRLTFATSDDYLPAVAKISKSIRGRRYASLPRRGHEALHRMSQVTCRRGWGFRFREDHNLGIRTASVKQGTTIPAPPPNEEVKGSTTMLGLLMRVGGVRPKAELRLANRSDLLYVEVTEEIAKTLAERLYEHVSLEGEATWDPETWRVLAFKVTRVTEYSGLPPQSAFRELANVANDAWEDVDVLDYVRRHREGGGGDLH